MWPKRLAASKWKPSGEEVAMAWSTRGRTVSVPAIATFQLRPPLSEGADFAHIDDARGNAGGAHQIDDAVGDPALGDAVERQRHTGAGEGDAGAAGANGVETDAGAGLSKGRGGRAGRFAAGGEVGGVEAPERLDSGSKAPPVWRGSGGSRREWRRIWAAGRRERRCGSTCSSKVSAVEAEDRLEVIDLKSCAREQTLSSSAIGVVQDKRSERAQSAPYQVTTSRSPARCVLQERDRTAQGDR